MKTIDGIAVFGQSDEKTLAQARGVAAEAEHVALMADNHLGYHMPIGGVAAYDNKVSVTGVGFDIACGNCAIKTDLKYELDDVKYGFVESERNEIADEIAHTISFGIGRTNRADDAPLDHMLFGDDAWNILVRPGPLRDKARAQLGTVGSGNHYVDVFVDRADGAVWVGVHFGSRGLGHAIATMSMAIAAGKSWDVRVSEAEAGAALLDLGTYAGQDYWALMELAGQYAYAGREWVARKVVSILGATEVDIVHNHHNFAWWEEHGGRDLVVVRKGATPAWPGQRGFVGGSMGDDSVILQGATAPDTWYYPEDHVAVLDEQRQALYSTVHGAGRVMSRTEAAGKRNRKTGEIKKPGKVSPEMMRAWLDERGVILRGGGLDESPHAYRRLPDVLAAQGPTIKVTNVLRPLIVVMAGANEFDPYKD